MTQEEILSLMKTDPEKGLKTVVFQYTGLVYKIVLHKLSSICPSEDIEETVSDVFLDFYKNHRSVDLSKGSLASFLIILAQRRAVDVFRKAVRQENIDALLSENAAGKTESTDAIVLEKAEREILFNAVLKLGEPDSTIVFRKFYYGETYEEIGNRLGLSANAVNKRYLRSVEKLSSIMKGENISD